MASASRSDSTRERAESRVLLQLALDDRRHLSVLDAVIDCFDIIEIGTPLLKELGVSVVTDVLARAGDRPVLVDAKTVDGGAREAEIVFAAGARLMTVLAVASAETLRAASEVAERFDGAVVLDTLCGGVPDRPALYPDRVTHVGLHRAKDRQLTGVGAESHIHGVAGLRALGYRVSLAGGIGPSNFARVVAVQPDVVVVGTAVTEAAHPREAARWLATRK